jgi:hypothetical protein
MAKFAQSHFTGFEEFIRMERLFGNERNTTPQMTNFKILQDKENEADMIEQYSFGKMIVSSKTYSSDLKIINGEVVPNWRRKTGHVVDVDDVTDILKAKPQYLIIGTGIGGRMKVTKTVKMKLKRLGIELVEEPTSEAIKIYNQMFDTGKNVAAGFHLTC